MLDKDYIPGDDESAFHQHFLKKGGLHFHGYVDYGNMLRASLNIFHDKLETYKAAIPAFPAINCNFIDNPAVNAVASKLPASEQYYLGIHIGTFHILNDLFLRMLSSRTILPWVGDASKEKDTCKLFNPQITDLDQLFLAKYNDPQGFMPFDYQRGYFAANYAKTALNFLFDHECGHIVSGHVRWVAGMGFTSMEEQDAPRAGISGMDSQTLEMDADGFAAHHGILYMHWLMQGADLLPKEKAAFIKDWETVLFNWTFAVYSLFRLFGYREYDNSRLTSYSHPPPGIRQRLMMLNLNQLLRYRLQVQFNKDPFDIMFDAIDHVEFAFNELSETPIKRNVLDFAYTEAGGRHLELILQNWPLMRDKLENHHYGYLAKANNP
jgi:hypothetical protein